MNFKKAILTLGLFSTVALNAADNNSLKHYGISVLLGGAAETVIHKQYMQWDDVDKVAAATAIGTIPGLAKELTDDHFSTSDLAFDVAGALTGAILSNYLNNNTTIFVSKEEKEVVTRVQYTQSF